MKIRSLLLLMPVACLSYAAISVGQESSEGSAGRLTRIRPAEEDQGEVQVPSPAFDPDHWELLLQEVDLEERETHFGRLVERARVDSRARGFLEELARETGRRELAWTARLALRELAANPVADLFMLGRGNNSLFQFVDPTSPDFQLFQVPGFGRSNAFEELLGPGWKSHGNSSSQGKSVRIQQDEDGWVIRIIEQKDGEEHTREYQGADLDEILEQNPELKGELEIGGGMFPSGPSELFQHNWTDRDSPLPGVLRFRLGEGAGPRSLFSRRGPSRPVRTDVLGVRVGPVSPERAHELSLPGGVGVHVDSVFPGTIAHILGVGSGDVLLKLNGNGLERAQDITDVLLALPEGEGLKLEWVDALGERQVRSWSPEGSEKERQERRDF